MERHSPPDRDLLYADSLRPVFIWWLLPILGSAFVVLGALSAIAGQIEGLVFAAAGVGVLTLGAWPVFTCRLEIHPGEIYVRGMSWWCRDFRARPSDVVEIRPMRYLDHFRWDPFHPDAWARTNLSNPCFIRGVSRSAVVTPSDPASFYLACEQAGFHTPRPTAPRPGASSGW